MGTSRHPFHRFPNGGDECGWNQLGEGGGGDDRARRGGTSSCHDEWDPGSCHIECGPGGGDLAHLIDRVRKSVREGNSAGLLRMMNERNADLVVYTPSLDRIDVITSCNPGGAAASFKVNPELAATLEQSSAVAAESSTP